MVTSQAADPSGDANDEAARFHRRDDRWLDWMGHRRAGRHVHRVRGEHGRDGSGDLLRTAGGRALALTRCLSDDPGVVWHPIDRRVAWSVGGMSEDAIVPYRQVIGGEV